MPWLDNLRVVLIAGVLVAHAATAYVVEVDWYYEQRTTSELVTTLFSFPVFMSAVFGLGPLFLVAGMMSARSLAAHGQRRFVTTRLTRLGVPLVLFCLFIDPLADWLGQLPDPGSVPFVDYLLGRTGDRDLGPMWFVAALLLFSLVYVAWRRVRPAAPTTDQAVTGLQLAAFATVIAVVSFAVWQRWSYVSPTPFNVNLGHWGQASGLFLLGVLAEERGWFATLDWGRARGLGWGAVIGSATLLVLAAVTVSRDEFELMSAGLHWQSATFAAVAGATGVCLSLWLAAWFRRRWNHAGAVMRKAGRGSYAAYVIHPVVLVLVSLAITTASVAPAAKFVVVAAVGVPLTFAAGYELTRVPGVRRIV